jgi:hypothetical protein
MCKIFYSKNIKIETVEDRIKYVDLYKKVFHTDDKDLNNEELQFKIKIIQEKLETYKNCQRKFYDKKKGTDEYNEKARMYYHKSKLLPERKEKINARSRKYYYEKKLKQQQQDNKQEDKQDNKEDIKQDT